MIAALFDFDGTLYTGHIWQDLARDHRSHQLRWLMAYVAWNMAQFPLYKLGLMSQETFYRSWGETMSWLLRGWTVDETHAIFERLTDSQIMPNLRPELLTLLRQHQASGHLVVLASGAFTPWLETIAQRLDVAHAVGTPLEMRDGCYTGRIIRPLCQGSGKLSRVNAYFEENGLDVDWQNSYAYGDGGTDLYLLRNVGHPVAVYPDKVLAPIALTEDWTVVGEIDQ